MRNLSGSTVLGALGVGANSAVRAATIGLRMGLVLAMAAWLGPAELGVYGLIAATVTLTSYLYGHDFYTFTVRQVSIHELGRLRYQTRDQFVLFGAIYVVGGIVLTAVLPIFGLDPILAALTAVIAALQHAGLEIYRILVRIERPLAASLCFFIRDAAWIPAILLLWLLRGDGTLFDVLGVWFIGLLIGTGFGVGMLLRALPAAPPRPIDPAWLARGVRTGLRMLPGTLSTWGLLTVDKMILALLVPPEVLGAYVFFATICGAFWGLFETGVLTFYWPRLLEAARHGDVAEQDRAQRALGRVCLIGAPALATMSLVVGAGFSWVLPHEAYAQHIGLLPYLAAAFMFLTLANVPHYRLYAGNRDLAIVLSNAASFAAFLALAGLLSLVSTTQAVPIALMAACMLMLALKWVAVWWGRRTAPLKG